MYISYFFGSVEFQYKQKFAFSYIYILPSHHDIACNMLVCIKLTNTLILSQKLTNKQKIISKDFSYFFLLIFLSFIVCGCF